MYPVLLSVGPLGVQTAGAVAFVAVWLSAAIAEREIARRGGAPALIHDFVVPGLIVGFIGARLGYVILFDPRWYLGHPWQIVDVWKGGLAEEGAFLAGLAAAMWWCGRRGFPFWVFADALAPALALGGAVVHLGAFLGGAGYGTPAEYPWAVTFTDPRSSAPLGIPLHPTQLYEAGLDLALLGALYLLRRRPRPAGQHALVFLLGTALIRLAVDTVKGDVIIVTDPVTSGQVAAAAVLTAATVELLRRARRGSALAYRRES